MTEPSPAAVLDGVFASSGLALCLLDPEGRVRRANAPWLDSVQREARDVVGRDVWELFPDAPAALRAQYVRARAGEVVEIPPHRQVLGGRERWYAGRLSPVPYPSGTGVLVTAWDVTVAKRVERTLAEAHARLRRHVASTPLALVEWDGDHRVIGYSRRAEELFGFPAQEVLGKRLEETPWVPEEDRPSVRALLCAWTGVRPGHVDATRSVCQDGRVVYCEWYSSALHDASGKLVSMLSLVLDVTSRHEATADLERVQRELRAANERLREADRRKDEFLAMLSHELRNPLAPIRNAVTILERATAGGAQAARAREVIARQVDHMTRLVDDLLDVTRIAHGKIALRPEPVDLAAVVRRAAEDHRPLFHERGLSLGVEVPGPVWLRADRTRVTQIVGNLLQNAAKFTGSGGRVMVALTAGEREAELRVADTGAGIPPELLARIFEPFVQGDQSLARTAGGLGLGLALVRAIAELHGGSVVAESPGPGGGATFVVRLPTASPG